MKVALVLVVVLGLLFLDVPIFSTISSRPDGDQVIFNSTTHSGADRSRPTQNRWTGM